RGMKGIIGQALVLAPYDLCRAAVAALPAGIMLLHVGPVQKSSELLVPLNGPQICLMDQRLETRTRKRFTFDHDVHWLVQETIKRKLDRHSRRTTTAVAALSRLEPGRSGRTFG